MSCRPFHTAGGRIRFVNIQPGSMLTRWKMSWLRLSRLTHVKMHRKLSKTLGKTGIHISGIYWYVHIVYEYISDEHRYKIINRGQRGLWSAATTTESRAGRNGVVIDRYLLWNKYLSFFFVLRLPLIHGDEGEIESMFTFEHALLMRQFEQARWAERRADGEQGQGRLFRLAVLSVKHLHTASDIQSLLFRAFCQVKKKERKNSITINKLDNQLWKLYCLRDG